MARSFDATAAFGRAVLDFLDVVDAPDAAMAQPPTRYQGSSPPS